MRPPVVNETSALPNVAIVGRPNVGKSALFNRLVGRKIAIVHDQAGITRDRISAICNRGARPFTVWDTGGIFGVGGRELSAQVRLAAEEALRESDLVLFVVDAKEGLSPVDEDLAGTLRKSQKPVVLVINKVDHEKHEPLAAEFDSLGLEPSVSISAEHDRGISKLLTEIERRLPSPVAPADIKHQTSTFEPPLAVAIVGRPNVGKSSLINSIVRGERAIVSELPEETRARIFFLEHAPVLTVSALTKENVEKLFASIETIQRAAQQRIGTGILNRLLRQAFQANPPPLVRGKRLKLFYAVQTRSGKQDPVMEAGAPATPQRPHPIQMLKRGRGSSPLQAPEFVLFVNDPRLTNETYRRYLETRIRKAEPYLGLPIMITLRPRAKSVAGTSRVRAK